MPYEHSHTLTGQRGWRCNRCRWFWEEYVYAEACEQRHEQNNELNPVFPNFAHNKKQETNVIDVDFSE
jgi:hypothetical protein